MNLSRSWVWQPKTGQVSYDRKAHGKPVRVTYIQSQLYKESAIVKDDVAPACVNYNYCLLFPFHVIWESPGPNLPGTAGGKPVRVSFSNVAVNFVGSDRWTKAQ